MRSSIYALASSLVLTAAEASASPRVAVVYSSWSNSVFMDEYDLHLQKLGWSVEKFENRQIPELIKVLDRFDIVLSSSVGNPVFSPPGPWGILTVAPGEGGKLLVSSRGMGLWHEAYLGP